MSLPDQIAAITGSDMADMARLAGDMGGAMRITLADGRRLIAKQGAVVEREGAMLAAIGATGAPVPAIWHCSANLLLMDFVEAGARPAWQSLAEALDLLHRPASALYGWEADYAFGAIAVRNAPMDNWPQFWAENRLLCHNAALHEAGHADIARGLESLAARLADLLPAAPPVSLLHGDLWGGNMLFDDSGIAALIDPASYYGHREVDIAMLTVFDHPPEPFFAACALQPGWRERLPVYRLWPLLIHLRAFGKAYRGQVKAALDAYGF